MNNKKVKENKFDFKVFQEHTSDIISDWFKDVPEDWKASAADFIACRAVIFGARDTYQGIGILEVVKKDYLELCEEHYMNESPDEDFEDGMCDECKSRLN